MVAAFDFVVRIAQVPIVAIVDRTRDRHALLDQAFGNHVRRSLPLEAGHAFIEIAKLPGIVPFLVEAALRPRTHDEPLIVFVGIPTPASEGAAEGSDMRHEVVFIQGNQGRACLRWIKQMPQADLVCPELAKHLIDVTACSHRNVVGVLRVKFVEEILSVIQLQDRFSPLVGNGFTFLRKSRVPHLGGHRFAGTQGRQVKRSKEGNTPEPSGVEGVMLRALQDAVAIGIALNHKLNRLLNIGPGAL